MSFNNILFEKLHEKKNHLDSNAGFELSRRTSQIAKWIPITAIEMFHRAWKMQSSFFCFKINIKRYEEWMVFLL